MDYSQTFKEKSVFPTTRWTEVLNGAGNSDEAIEARNNLAEKCWYPVFAFLRRDGWNAEDAADITQETLSLVFQPVNMEDLTPSRGRFRSWVLTCASNCANGYRRKQFAKRRAAFQNAIRWDEMQAEERFLREPASAKRPEEIFERDWAMGILEHTTQLLEKYYAAKGNDSQFKHFLAYLNDDPGSGIIRDIGNAIGMPEDAAKVALFRFRKRYQSFLRSILEATVSTKDGVEDELRQLHLALSL